MAEYDISGLDKLDGKSDGFDISNLDKLESPKPRSLFQKALTPLVSSERIKSRYPISAGVASFLPIYRAMTGEPGAIGGLQPDMLQAGAEEASSQTSPLAIAGTLLAAPTALRELTPAMARLRAPKLENKAISLYRRALNPSGAELRTIEAKGGGNINNAFKIAAEEQIPVSVVENKLDTTIARNQIKKKISLLDDNLTNKLSDPSNAKQFIDLKQVGSEAKRQARLSTPNDTLYKSIAQDIDEYINDAIKARSEYVSGANLNEIKRGMYEVGYNQMRPTADKSARFIGRTIRKKIEKLFPDENIKELNNTMGNYITLQRILEGSHGRGISVSKIKNIASRAAGAAAGSAVPIVGSVGGYFLGGEAAKLLTSPARMAGRGAKQASKAGIIQRSFKSAIK